MDPQRAHEIGVVFQRALDEPLSSRRAYLDEIARRDRAMAAEVEALLDRHVAAGDYFEELQASIGAALPDELAHSADAQQRIGPYRMVRRIGAGGMGVVFLAERADGQFEKRVALKLIRRGLESEAHIRRFLAERNILARLEHPNIARLLDGGVTGDGAPYFVMEYVEGEPLTHYCDERRLSVDERLRVLLEVGGAVQYLHRHLVIHGDLKPGNILVDRDGVVKMVDFGIALLLDETAGGDPPVGPPARMATGGAPDTPAPPADLPTDVRRARAFTPQYAAPEQIRGGPVSTATDVYALGIVLYELLAGTLPFDRSAPPGGTWSGPGRAILREPPAPSERSVAVSPTPPGPTGAGRGPAVANGEPAGESSNAGADPASRRAAPAKRLRGDLDAICLMALRNEPDERYGSVDQLMEDIRRHLARLPVRARRATLSYRAGRFLRRHALGTSVTVAILLLSLGFAGALGMQSARLARERDKAEHVAALLADLFRLADPGEMAGAEVTAREVLDRGAVRIRHELAGQPDVRADLLSVMGRVYQNLGLYDEARTLLEEAAVLTRATRGRRHPAVVESMNRLAAMLRLQGEYPAAEALLREAVALAPRDPATRARTLDRLGLTLLDRGELDDAEVHLSAALALNRRHLPPGDPEIAENLANLGGVRVARGDLAAADPLFREALALRRGTLGPRHPAVAATLNNLAAVLGGQGRFAEAVAMQEEALALYRDLLGDEHPRIATMLNNFGLLHLRRGDAAAAEASLQRSLEMRQRLLPAGHPELAQSLANLALALQELGRYGEAAPRYVEALEIRRAALGPAHPVVAQTIHNLGLLQQATGEHAAAESSIREARAIFEQAVGSEHPLLAISHHDLGALLREMGDLAGAERAYRRALEIRRVALPPEHPHRALTKLGLAEVLLARGDTAAAALLLSAAAPLLDAAYGAADARTARARTLLAAAGGGPG
jgi:eukaryotic-like serine/threonine-protein kinase